MANYDFSTLNSSDLEELVCDLLNMEESPISPIKYKTFKDGKDKGIDFLYSTEENNYEHVGQVKHYYRTGYDGMFSVLKDTEVKNVTILKPNRYIVATSVDLNVNNTEAIKKIFEPFIKNLNDIYGKKDLNRLIEKHSMILDSHYKLWLSDFSILSKILNSHLQFRSAYFIDEELKKRLRIYVKTKLFEKARTSLEKNKFIIIAGEPGVGKTTLAEMLLYEYIAKEYNLTYIIDDIREAEQVFIPDDSKQIIYFDDFLGSNEVEINKARGSESRLLNLLNRIEKYKNKYIVFTTRNHLLNTAILGSEKLQRFNIKTQRSLFELKEYDKDLKTKLLNNHIDDSGLDKHLIDVLKSDKIQKFIINHLNFTPRSVEFICDKVRSNNYTKEEFEGFIYKVFNKPDVIWNHAYTVQITENCKFLLNTLLSFGQSANIKELEEAFLERINYEVINNNKKKEMHVFVTTLQQLEEGFIIIKNNTEIYFINPSLIDFLVDHLRKDKDEVRRIAECVKYVSQLTERLFSLANPHQVKMSRTLQERILLNHNSFINKKDEDYEYIQLALVVNKYVEIEGKDEVICDIIDSITNWEELHEDYYLNQHFKEFILAVKDNDIINPVLQERIEQIVTDLFIGKDDINEAIDLLEELSEKFDLDFDKLDNTNIINHLDYLFSEQIDQDIEWLRDWMTIDDEAYYKKKEFEDLNKKIVNIGLEYDADLSEFDIDWYEIATDNEIRRLMEKD
ncbi:AAA family ATPase [Flavobacterium sp. 2]|uniref:nSTAND3 domain-containing NTPase n=1 Tax=Flavobacterium sp. 2 TaxID=308053 RepID=UPI000C1A4B1F|nr:AAA family ATPase [Flavobacterium sp. 2]PIF59791.1 ATPase family protein associated with various cellular activities (AAA) [Flavobacterium sp. 2]